MNETDPRASRSRTALLNAGIEALTRNPDATLSEIAQAAGVGRATLYRHFETREQLLVALASASMAETDQACSHILEQNLTGREAIEEIFISVMPLANRFHFLLTLWGLVDNNEGIVKTYSRQLSQLHDRIEEAKNENSIEQTLPNEWLVAMIDNLLYTGWYCVASGSLGVEQASLLAIRTFFDGVGKKTQVSV